MAFVLAWWLGGEHGESPGEDGAGVGSAVAEFFHEEEQRLVPRGQRGHLGEHFLLVFLHGGRRDAEDVVPGRPRLFGKDALELLLQKAGGVVFLKRKVGKAEDVL